MLASLKVKFGIPILGFCWLALSVFGPCPCIGQENNSEGQAQDVPAVVEPDKQTEDKDKKATKPDQEGDKSSDSDSKSAQDEDSNDLGVDENDKPESDKNKGQADLDKAFQLKISATSTRDLDKVADLCESAIEKGLSKESEEQAKELWTSVLMSHAKQLNRRIMPNGKLSTRWRWLRSQAISRLNKVTEIRPARTDALILLARLHSMDSGDQAIALESIEKAIAQISDDKEKLSEALFIRARLAEDEKSRIADLTQAVKINPQNADALMARAAYFLQNEKSEEAMADFKALLAIDTGNSAPDDISSARHRVIAQLLRDGQMYKESAEVLGWAIDAHPENEELYVLRGQAYFSAEDDEKALDDFNKALDINRQNTAALSFRSRVYLFQEKYEEALTDANELMQQKPDSPEGLALRSLIHRSQEKLDEAIEDTEELLEMDSDNLDYQFDLAILLNANEQPSKAIPIFDRIIDAIAVDAAKTQILRNRGDAYLSLGEHQKAIDDYELAIELMEENPGSKYDGMSDEREADMKAGLLNNLAWVLATSPMKEIRDGKKAIELATEASEITDYKAAFILSTLASGYAEVGDFETARKWAAKAVELAESDEQRVGLKEELESYEKDEPWRELENVEAGKDSDDGESEKSGSDDDSKKEDATKQKSDKDNSDKPEESEKEKSDGDGDSKQESDEQDDDGKSSTN